MVTQKQTETQSLYDRDFYLWIQTTIAQLRAGQFTAVDLENLIEELDSMGKSQKRAIKSLLTRLLEHLLKLKYWNTERERNEGHWKGEIRTFRREIQDILKDSPSLKPYLREISNECYQNAIKVVIDRSRLPLETFPVTLVDSVESILDEDYF